MGKWQLGNVFYLKIILCILCFEKVKKNVSVLQEMVTVLLDLNLELTPLNEMQFWKKASKYFKIWIFLNFFFKEKGIKKQKSFPETEVLQFLPMWLFSAVD